MKTENYTRAIVLVHGKSELEIVRYIKSKLRIPIEIYARDGGSKNIEISSVNDVLSSLHFKTPENFVKKFCKIKTDSKGKPQDFKIFIILDVDNTNEKTVRCYMDKSLFPKSWLKKYIHPIKNDNNLEEVLNKLGYYYAKNNKQKKMYKRAFPVEGL